MQMRQGKGIFEKCKEGLKRKGQSSLGEGERGKGEGGVKSLGERKNGGDGQRGGGFQKIDRGGNTGDRDTAM